MATEIQFTEVTTGDISGTGVFDQLMRSIKAHITQEYEAGRITGKDYATVYLGGMQSAIKEAVTFVLQKDLVANNVEKATKEVANIEAQTALYERQMQGFDDNKYQKLFEAQLNSWGLMFSSGMLTTKPDIISSDAVSTLYNTLKPQT